LQDAEFNVDAFCSYMAMSRMQLHRKLKATLGTSAIEFLNRERLGIAKTLLLQSELNIAEIAYTAGFNNPNYFGRIFKKSYGHTPSAFRSMEKAD